MERRTEAKVLITISNGLDSKRGTALPDDGKANLLVGREICTQRNCTLLCHSTVAEHWTLLTNTH